MFKGMLHMHITSVMVFLIIYLIKTILLVAGATEKLETFKARTKVLEMIVSTAFLLTGGYMLFNIPEIKPLLVIKIAIVFASIPTAIIAFKKGNKGLAILSLVMIIASYGLAEMSKKRSSSPSKIDMSNIKNNDEYGANLYRAECNKCHGEDGKLGISGAFDLSTSKLTEEEAKQIISNGRGAMVGYKDMYSEQQIELLATYIQSLKK
jgi:cytochrome c553